MFINSKKLKLVARLTCSIEILEDSFKVKNKFGPISLSRRKMPQSQTEIWYSDKYSDNYFEYRHVTLPTKLASLVPRNHLVSRNLTTNVCYFFKLIFLYR
jgi:hypothetical protein